MSLEDPKQTDTMLAEYSAVRDEILMRLKAQQDLLRYALLVAALLPPLVGLGSVIGPHGLLAMLLLGPVICIFIQGIYLKHHWFIELSSDYVTKDLIAGWERHLTDALYQRPLPYHLSGLLGYLEGGLPTLVGVLYLSAFIVVTLASMNSLDLLPMCFLVLFFFADVAALVLLVLAGITVRSWVADQRRAAAKQEPSDKQKSGSCARWNLEG
jgi:hypothetical protein